MVSLVEHGSVHTTEGLATSRMRLLFAPLKIATSRLAVHRTLRGERVIQAQVILEDLWLVPRLLLLLAELVLLLKVNESLLLFPWWRKRLLTLLSLVIYYRLVLLIELRHISNQTTFIRLDTKHTMLWIKGSKTLIELLLIWHCWKVCELLLLKRDSKVIWPLPVLLKVLRQEEVVSRKWDLLSLLLWKNLDLRLILCIIRLLFFYRLHCFELFEVIFGESLLVLQLFLLLLLLMNKLLLVHLRLSTNDLSGVVKLIVVLIVFVTLESWRWMPTTRLTFVTTSLLNVVSYS